MGGFSNTRHFLAKFQSNMTLNGPNAQHSTFMLMSTLTLTNLVPLDIWVGVCSPSCYIVSLINIDNWPCLRINNFQQMNQTGSLAETSTLHDFVPMMHYVICIADSNLPIRLVRVQPLVNKSRCFLW